MMASTAQLGPLGATPHRQTRLVDVVQPGIIVQTVLWSLRQTLVPLAALAVYRGVTGSSIATLARPDFFATARVLQIQWVRAVQATTAPAAPDQRHRLVVRVLAKAEFALLERTALLDRLRRSTVRIGHTVRQTCWEPILNVPRASFAPTQKL